MLIKDGVPAPEDLQTVIPSKERLAKGAVAVIECFQEIPCDHCFKVCPNKAIGMDGLHGVPKLNENRCVGCGNCLNQCPGQAIFIVDMSDSRFAKVRFPFEYLPLPKPGEQACGVDREGRELGWFEVTEVTAPLEAGRTRSITVKVPRELAQEVRNIKAGGYR